MLKYFVDAQKIIFDWGKPVFIKVVPSSKPDILKTGIIVKQPWKIVFLKSCMLLTNKRHEMDNGYEIVPVFNMYGTTKAW